MIWKVAAGVVLGLLLVSGVLAVWGSRVLGSDAVRAAIARQLTHALEQPVSIEGIGVSVFPRLRVTLRHVVIGSPATVTAETFDFRTSLGTLLSRRIEHANIRLAGVEIQLPLPAIGLHGATSAGDPAPVTIGSVDDITLDDVRLVSGGRTIGATARFVPRRGGVDIDHMSLSIDGETIDVSGRLSDLSGPMAELTVRASTLSLDRLLLVASDFTRGTGFVSPPAGMPPGGPRAVPTAPGAPPATMATAALDVTLTLAADRATLAGLALGSLSGRGRFTPATFSLNPVAFDVFGGHYDGAMTVSLGERPAFRLNASVTGIDTAALLAFVGAPDAITGRAGGRIDVSGRGLSAAAIRQTAAGTAHLSVDDGMVRRLGLVRTIVLAGSMRTESQQRVSGQPIAPDERFSKLQGTFAIAGGVARTGDLSFDSTDLHLGAAGAIGLDGETIALSGPVQLSAELSRQAGRDLLRYTQDDGRVTVPVRIDGSARHPAVSIDLKGLTKRAIGNRAAEEIERAAGGAIDRLIKR